MSFYVNLLSHQSGSGGQLYRDWGKFLCKSCYLISQGVEVNYTEAEVSFYVNLAISSVRMWRSTIQRLR